MSSAAPVPQPRSTSFLWECDGWEFQAWIPGHPLLGVKLQDRELGDPLDGEAGLGFKSGDVQAGGR